MKIKKIQELGQDLYDSLDSNTSLLFIFGDKKSTEFFINKDTDINVFIPVMNAFIKSCGVSDRLYWLPWYKCRIMVSKDRKLLEKFNIGGFKGKNGNLVASQFFEIPNCCTEKYIKDKNKNSSRESFFRYKKQLIDLKIKKDVYEIGWGTYTNLTNCNAVGFIPCHPNCKKAKKILNNLNRIKKKLGYNDGR